MTGNVSRAVRLVSVALVLLRLVLPLIAVPLIPVLIRDRLALLVLLRPQKEFLLLAGARLRLTGEPSLAVLVAAYLPFMILAVWAFFIVGRVYRNRILGPNAPAWLQRAIPPRHLDIAQRILARRGPWIAVLGRLAAFPPTVLAAAAGTSEVSARRYLIADLTGAAISFAAVVAAGFALGRAYEQGGWWFTAAGAAVFVVMVVLLTRWVRNAAAAAPHDTAGYS